MELTGRGLRVTGPDAPGCCEHVERIADAVVFVLGFFAERRVAERGR
ncbi:hypothetical protein [Actinomadura rugatobispora]|uniref:Uncharacterized protein n=1 Tax=Actinomadura rugatobispora TaxID=1994 RepID=A0ABW1A792_9ACTN